MDTDDPAQVTAAETSLKALLVPTGGRVVLTSSGLTALELALRAQGIGPGDRVGCDALYPYAALAIANTGATPVAFDLDRHTLQPDAASVWACVEAGATAVVITAYFGTRPDDHPLADALIAAAITVVEDRAQSFGRHRDPWSGSLSFQTGKMLSCGQGGAVLLPDGNDGAVRQLVNLGWWPRTDASGWTSGWEERIIGRSARMAPACAALLVARIAGASSDQDHIERWVRSLGVRLHEVFEDNVRSLPCVGARLAAATAAPDVPIDEVVDLLESWGVSAARPSHPTVTAWPGFAGTWGPSVSSLEGTVQVLEQLILLIVPPSPQVPVG